MSVETGLRTEIPSTFTPSLRADVVVSSGAAPLGRVVVGLLLAFLSYGTPMVVAGQAGDGPIATVAVVLAVGIPTGALLATNNFRMYLSYLVCLLLIQNFAVGLWLPNGMLEVPLIVTESKTVSVALAALFSVGPILKYLSEHKRIRLFLILYFLSIVASVRGLEITAFAYGRNFIFPILFLMIVVVRTSGVSLQERMVWLKEFVYMTVGIMAVGVLAELVMGPESWRAFLHIDRLTTLGGVSVKTDFLGLRLDRYAGILIEPTNAGYIAAAAAALLLVMIPRYKVGRLAMVLFLVLALVLLFLSAAKSGLLMLLPAVVAVVIGRYAGTGRLLIFTSAAGVFFVGLYLVLVKGIGPVISSFVDPIRIVGGDSTTFHWAGLISGITASVTSPIGHGLGVGGNFAKGFVDDESAKASFSGKSKVATGGESAWGVLGYQAGIIGVILLVILLVVLSNQWGIAAAVVISVWSVSAMFAEAIFGIQVAALLMIGAALLREEAPPKPIPIAPSVDLTPRRTPALRPSYRG